jgi:NAD(P)-dependent dehydrogenase (short-subunit alcohol dehydrogenase family)
LDFSAQSVYVSSKFALEGLSESFAYEVEPYGISVVLIEPGVINTDFVENIMIPDNTQHISSHLLPPSSPCALPPKEVAKVILESINDSVVSTRQGGNNNNNNFYRYPVGKDAKLYADVKKKMSDSELHSLVAKRILS